MRLRLVIASYTWVRRLDRLRRAAYETWWNEVYRIGCRVETIVADRLTRRRVGVRLMRVLGYTPPV